MKRFLAVMYGGSPTGDAAKRWGSLTKELQEKWQKEGGAAWMAWAQKNAAHIKDMGSPLGRTKNVDKKGVSDTRNELTAWTVVEAPDHQTAAEMFKEHPHFMIFPGDRIEIMECLPIPTF